MSKIIVKDGAELRYIVSIHPDLDVRIEYQSFDQEEKDWVHLSASYLQRDRAKDLANAILNILKLENF